MAPREPQRESLRFVTRNPGKVQEVAARLAALGIEVVQDDRGYPEVQADTLEEVARAGAEHLLAEGLEAPFLLEDAGLFVTALGGFPGVYSRYTLDTIGCQGILRLLRDVEAEMRGAHFEACLLYVDPSGRPQAFRGACPGHVATAPQGVGGFGFDPIFVPEGHDRTFAQMPLLEKAALSHRGRALALLEASLAKQQKHKRGTAWSSR